MDDQRAWFSEIARRRVTVTELAEHLGVSRKTAQTRLEAGLSSDDIIAIARALHISPSMALVELGKLTYDEVFTFLEGGGKLIETASEAELALELAERLNPASVIEERLAEIVDMHARRQPASADPPKRRADLSNLRGAASRRVKEMYPETPDEGL
ncbi:hypothetical protein GTA26_05315 [Rhodococcus hoagii]|nr:hypothetical protein [Prescottella equi]NKZ94840.1 hypothetical protein [Prescottella equi]